MRIPSLHRWDVTYREAIQLQETLREKLILDRQALSPSFRTIAGADISYDKTSDLFYAAVVLMDVASLDIIEERFALGKAAFPYIPGLLSFREGPLLLQAFEQLHQSPDIVIFDGQGIAHPRRFGLASHLGLFLDIPAIGCAKKKLIGIHGEVGAEIGAWTPLMDRDSLIGAVVRTKRRVKPVFISAGHRIGLQNAVDVVLASCRGYRLPEPVRHAHLAVNRLRKERGAAV